VNVHILHPRYEVENITAAFTLTETVPDIFAHAHPELGRVLALVNGAGTAQAIPAPFEPVEDIIVDEHLLHGNGRFDGPEVNEHVFGHTTPLF
jgi:NAD(P)-dependent dehydrogenase (short-subunit alcohol dehydrogenase family)